MSVCELSERGMTTVGAVWVAAAAISFFLRGVVAYITERFAAITKNSGEVLLDLCRSRPLEKDVDVNVHIQGAKFFQRLPASTRDLLIRIDGRHIFIWGFAYEVATGGQMLVPDLRIIVGIEPGLLFKLPKGACTNRFKRVDVPLWKRVLACSGTLDDQNTVILADENNAIHLLALRPIAFE